MNDLFSQRVAIEREIINTVNSSEQFPFELSGLTAISINDWCLKNSTDKNNVISIAETLLSLATATHSIVNVSDEIFCESDDLSIEEMIYRLKIQVRPGLPGPHKGGKPV